MDIIKRPPIIPNFSLMLPRRGISDKPEALAWKIHRRLM